MPMPRLDSLPPYPFQRLATLLGDLSPGKPPLDLSLGEPKEPAPALLAQVLARETAGWNRYPPSIGTEALRHAIARWAGRRFGLRDGAVDPAQHVLPVAGTREALFLALQAVLMPEVASRPPLVALPNPFYQVYLGGLVMAGARPLYLPTTAETGFLPDLRALETVGDDLRAVILCTPANPQGRAAPLSWLIDLVRSVRDRGAVLLSDECYGEVYRTPAPPAGALEACVTLDGPDSRFDSVMSFHSLSKRSSVPGLRSGAVIGDAALMAQFRKLRSYGGATLPLPLQAAAAALWDDAGHVTHVRDTYARKMAKAGDILGPDVALPDGGFFLWLPVGDGEAFARRAWGEAGVKVLPGGYLGYEDPATGNPGTSYVRVALVHDETATTEALVRLRGLLAAQRGAA